MVAIVSKATAGGGDIDNPRFERVNWRQEPHLKKLYFMSIFLLIASATTGYDGMLANTAQQMDKFKRYFSAENGKQNDPTIMLGCVIMIVGGIVSAVCNGYGMWMAGRFILGFGNSFAQMCSPLLLTEICHPQHRGPLTAVYNCLWNLGALIVSVVALRCLVDSRVPRYLVSKDKADKALEVLVKHHGGGDINNATVQFEYREIKETISMEAQADSSSSYIDFFKTKGNRWRLAIIISLGIISQYSGNALFSNYIDRIYEGAGITGENKKLGLSAGKTIMDLTIAIGAALTVDKVGRRPLFLAAITGMVASFVCWTIVGAVYENSNMTNEGAGIAQIVFVWFFGVFYDIGFSGLLVAYALEILPFALRAKGMMILNITIQAILAIGNQTNLLAWNNLPRHWHFMLFYTLWDFCELIFVWFFYVETKGPTLEEIARIFDGDDAVAHVDLDQVEKEIRSAEHDEDIHAGGLRSEKTAV
ncbi:unnamed protein product [Parascedosporium putredinis]|uniref:Major facilitator superfamily (MFS) profile domain-containing protein n=1 Tax=Parascedosporium putredinis TaxID=1442378 RepID=A0A9P1ME56_9PEZI|nr:unnamed protein product [Parascedosporium putredinis]CAI7999815.1 unnamed protein product [Parascedosporium putredinis]